MPKVKPDAAVERLVRQAWQACTRAELRAIITEARQSAARECAEIAEKCEEYVAMHAIRERFKLEGK